MESEIQILLSKALKSKIEFDEKKETDLRTVIVGLRMGADEIYDIFVKSSRDNFKTGVP